MSALRGLPVLAADGPVGTLADVYFHDMLWLVQSLAVNTADPARRALIPVSSVQRCRLEASAIRMDMALEAAPLVGRTIDPSARSARSMLGYAIEAADGVAGRIVDVIVDDAGWWIPDLLPSGCASSAGT